MTLKKIALIPHVAYLTCAKFLFFPWCGFGDYKGPMFLLFSTWLPHNVTDDIIFIIKTFYMSSHTYGENFLSIQ